MPEGECCQERNYDSLISPGRCSLANGLAEAKLEIYSATGGLDYLFHKHDVDALIFAIELGQPAVWVGIEGFPAVSDFQSSCPNLFPYKGRMKDRS